MAIRPDGIAKRQLRTLFHLGTIGHLTDGQLLERFATRSGSASEMAFAALVDRHGPLVLRVCRTVLRDEHDAQDAFQATFVVLVRKGKTLWVRESIGPWLHAVALRAARGARASRERRRAREGGVIMSEHEPSSLPAADLDGLGQALHEEIERLPTRFRTPIILCDLEGLTHEQASQAIGCPVGTIKSRLSRGRSRLRARLTRRGLAPVVGVGVSLITSGTRASVPGMLANATIEIATHSAAGTLTGALIPSAVAGIAGGVSHAMMFAKLKLIAVPVLAVGVAAGAGLGTGFDEKDTAEGRGTVAAALKPREDILLYEVKPERLETSIEVRGNLDSSRMSDVRSPFEGPMTLRSIVPEGTRVKAGDVVCELDSSGLQQRNAEQLITVERSTADLQNAKTTLEVAELNVQEYLEGVFPQELKIIEGEIKLAQSELERANEKVKNIEKKYKLSQHDKKNAPVDIVNKELELLGVRYKLMRAEFNLEQAEKRREDLDHFTRAKTVKSLEADINEAKALVITAETSLNLEREKTSEIEKWIKQCTIVAPDDGIVIVMLEGPPEEWEGSSVRPNQLLFRILDLNEPMQANVKVPEAWVDRVKTGDRVQVKVDAFPNWEFAGRVSEIKPLPDPTIFFNPQQNRVYTTIVDLDEPHPGLRPGLTLSARLHVTFEDALCVPARAVLSHEGASYVALRVGPGRFEWREVSVGRSSGAYVGISEGLDPADMVAINPITVLRRDDLKRSPGQP